MQDRIKILRKKLNLTQKEFAKKLGLNQNTISSIEKGKNKINDRYISAICAIFSVNKNWLCNGEGEIFINTSFNIEKIDNIKEIYFSLDNKKKSLLKNFLLELITESKEDELLNYFSNNFLKKIENFIIDIKNFDNV